jgi:hypothetical protein
MVTKASQNLFERIRRLLALIADSHPLVIAVGSNSGTRR